MNLHSADPQTLTSFFEMVGASAAVLDVYDEREIRLLSTNRFFRAVYRLDDPSNNDLLLPRDIAGMFEESSCDCARRFVPIDFEHLLNPSQQWLRVRMIPVLPDEDNARVVRIFATAVDITAKRRLEQDLQVSNIRLNSVLDSSFEGIITVDTQQKIRTFNQAASRIFGYTPDEAIGQPLEMLIPERFRKRHPDYVRNFQRSGDTMRAMESRVEISALRKDGSEFLAEISLAKFSAGGILEFCAFIRDISEHMRLIDELYLRASTDPLTGLYNRHHLSEVAIKELARARRTSRPTAAMLIDLDDFKKINDFYGHSTGDRVLQEAARICRRQSRQSDIAARWGGEEFVLLLPDTDINNAMHQAERILKDMRALHTGIDRLRDHRITASIGVSMLNGTKDSFEALVERADQAMYVAKNMGKNRVVSDRQMTGQYQGLREAIYRDSGAISGTRGAGFPLDGS